MPTTTQRPPLFAFRCRGIPRDIPRGVRIQSFCETAEGRSCPIRHPSLREVDMEDVRRILVVATEIKHSRKGVHFGVSLARKYGADLLVLHVEHDPFGAEGWNLPFLSFDEEYKEVLRQAKKDLGDLIRAEEGKGLPVREMIRKGEPVAVIRKVVEEEKIDLLVLLSHEENRLEHFLFGRANEAIIRKMPCSILLVKDEGA